MLQVLLSWSVCGLTCGDYIVLICSSILLLLVPRDLFVLNSLSFGVSEGQYFVIAACLGYLHILLCRNSKTRPCQWKRFLQANAKYAYHHENIPI